MTLLSACRISARVLLGLAIFAASMPLSAGDAEARRVRVNPIGVGATIMRQNNRNSEASSSATESGGAEDATAGEAADNFGADATPRAMAAKAGPAVTPPVNRDLEVEGCAVGMICIVCLAGCNGEPNIIVHAAPKASRHE